MANVPQELRAQVEKDGIVGAITAEVLGALVQAHEADLIAQVYSTYVEALIHPYNTEAVDLVKDYVSMREGVLAEVGPGAEFTALADRTLADGQKVLDALGIKVEPGRYRKVAEESAPTGQAIYEKVKAKVGEAMLRQVPMEGPVN